MSDDELFAGWDALEPPPDFVEQVLERALPPVSGREPRPARRRWVVALALAAALLLGLGLAARWPSDGQVFATTQTAVALGHRGAAVAAVGAELDWQVGWAGDLAVSQSAGQVFYRIEPGGSFTLITPAGRITAAGACFTVEVSPMGRSVDWKRPLLAGFAGAALSAAVLVTVYEGRVDLSQAGATASVAPGERAAAVEGQPPRALSAEPGGPPAARVAALERENERLQAEVAALESAVELKRAVPADPAELARLRTAVSDLERALAQEEVARAKEEGIAQPFPDDLPADYRETGMREAFAGILEQAGLDGEVFEVDCEEFPCIVYGQTRHAGQEAMNAEMASMQRQLGARFDRATHDVHSSVWGNFSPDSEAQENVFGMAVYPKDVGGDPENLKKRMRLRQTTFMDAWRAKHKPPSEQQ